MGTRTEHTEHRMPVAVTVACMAVVCVLAIASVVLHVRDWLQIGDLQRQVRLLRSVAVGRTRAEVAAFLGNPDRTFKIPDRATRAGETALMYMGSGQRQLGFEDVCVIVGPDDRVVAVYYTDLDSERQLLDRRK